MCPSETQRLVVMASYSNDTKRDVTRQAHSPQDDSAGGSALRPDAHSARVGRSAALGQGRGNAAQELDFGAISKIIGDCDANIIDVYHQRAFSSLPVKQADLDVVLETLDRDHIADIISKLTAAGFQTREMKVETPALAV